MIEIKPICEGTIIRILSRPCFLIVTELQSYGLSKSAKPMPITYAVSKSGDYIGTVRVANRLVNKYGISVFEGKVCSVGYNLQKKLWYGWSHRAIFGFKRKRDAVRFARSVS